jgi:hypothetical protein
MNRQALERMVAGIGITLVEEQVQVFRFLTWGLPALHALLGLAILRGHWRRAQILQPTSPAPAQRAGPALG